MEDNRYFRPLRQGSHYGWGSFTSHQEHNSGHMAKDKHKCVSIKLYLWKQVMG